MKPYKIILISLIGLLLGTSITFSGDFDWMRDFNIRAEADPSGLRARLETRFRVGDLDIKTVLSNTDCAADAYMLLRLGEISNHPMAYIIEKYKSGKGQGWGNIAKNLGIKPGSRDFHSLKQGQDLFDNREKGKPQTKGKGKSKGRK